MEQLDSLKSKTEAEPPTEKIPLDRARYRRVVRFFAGVFARFILWEVVLRAILGERTVARSRTQRWQRIAERFRMLAVELGGVLIKLGQFLSIRVDVLPREVTAELAGLQDEVPAERTADIQAVIEAEYGQPLDTVFTWFAPAPDAAASLAQVHRARLLTGDEVVVKVQRPRIETTVETDLRAIRTGIRWIRRYRPVRRRVDIDRLYQEFSDTTRRELDFVAEGHNAETFAENFAGDEGVRIPRVYAESSTRRVLIMENVASIKITDIDALDAAGINRRDVARRLFDTYVKQLFTDNFLHADPHPGNLFIQPLTSLTDLLQRLEPSATRTGPPEGTLDPSDMPGRPFRLVFVDFGMVATVPERIRPHLRDFLIGFASKDAGRLVRAYQGAGFLLPGADLARIEQIEAEMLDRFSGLTLREAQQAAMSEWQELAHEYRDILYEMPFQIPADLLFMGRAMAILFGLSISLDPDFDPWKALTPYAAKMAGEEARGAWRVALKELGQATRHLITLPGQADRFFSQANRGQLTVQTSWPPDAMRTLQRLEAAVGRLGGAVIFAAFLLSATAVHVTDGSGPVSYTLFALAGIAFLAILLRRPR
jgi:predicted unusual protein kinase regulating ubiquinone biosynthesis (AarF/ABC1/UbiB family)